VQLKIAAPLLLLSVLVPGEGVRAESADACVCPPPADHAAKELSRHQGAFAGTRTPSPAR
jgi:hypothetical protein